MVLKRYKNNRAGMPCQTQFSQLLVIANLLERNLLGYAQSLIFGVYR